MIAIDMPLTNPNLNTLLFYTCVTPQVGNQCEEGYTLDQEGVVTRGFSQNFTTIEAGSRANISTLFAVHDTFFDNGAGLRKDWQHAWSALQTKLEPLIEARTVVGFFVGDELFPGKIQYSDFLTALKAMQTMKDKYPWLVTWENEGGTNWPSYFKDGVPDELDIVSFDDYYLYDKTASPQSQADGHRRFYESSIYPLLKPHQKVYLVPGSFGTHQASLGPQPPRYPFGNASYCYSATFDGCDRYMADQANAFAAWAFEDQRVAGIAPWHWDTRKIGVVSPYKEVGTAELPKTKEAWRAIGQKMRAAAAERERR